MTSTSAYLSSSMEKSALKTLIDCEIAKNVDVYVLTLLLLLLLLLLVVVVIEVISSCTEKSAPKTLIDCDKNSKNIYEGQSTLNLISWHRRLIDCEPNIKKRLRNRVELIIISSSSISISISGIAFFFWCPRLQRSQHRRL